MVNSKVFSSSCLSLKSQSLDKILGSLEPIRFFFHTVFINLEISVQQPQNKEKGRKDERQQYSSICKIPVLMVSVTLVSNYFSSGWKNNSKT